MIKASSNSSKEALVNHLDSQNNVIHIGQQEFFWSFQGLILTYQ